MIQIQIYLFDTINISSQQGTQKNYIPFAELWIIFNQIHANGIWSLQEFILLHVGSVCTGFAYLIIQPWLSCLQSIYLSTLERIDLAQLYFVHSQSGRLLIEKKMIQCSYLYYYTGWDEGVITKCPIRYIVYSTW